MCIWYGNHPAYASLKSETTKQNDSQRFDKGSDGEHDLRVVSAQTAWSSGTSCGLASQGPANPTEGRLGRDYKSR
jgi:hypothetical protein